MRGFARDPPWQTPSPNFEAVAARVGEMAGAYASGERRREYRDHRLEWMVKSGGIHVVLAGLRDNTIRFPWLDPP